MKSVNSSENNINYFNITIEAQEIVNNDYKNENIIYAIEEINKEFSMNKYPVLTQTNYELFIIYENNKEYILNYYKKDKLNNRYSLEKVININDLDKTNHLYTFLKNYANYNDDKKLKLIIKRKIE